MIAGHFGLAAAVKSRVTGAPLWALMLATVWLDVLFVPLVVSGVEGLDPVAGSRGGYGEVIIHADYTHALIGALAISALFGVVAAIPWGRTIGAVLGAVVFSHWLLDLPMHRHDMPLFLGGGGARFGFGLWRAPGWSAGLELAIVVVGALLYWRAAQRASGGAPAKANLSAGVLLGAGLLTLGLNVLGM